MADPADPDVRETLAAAIAELPATWREVIIARDADDNDAIEVGERLGLTPRQQRAILNPARASLRERLARRLTPDADRGAPRSRRRPPCPAPARRRRVPS